MKRMVALTALLTLTWVWAESGSTAGDAEVGGSKGGTGGKAGFDQEFVTKAASSGMAEVKIGKLAEERGTNAMVKKFGKRMVLDHTKANMELKMIAKAKGFKLPTHMLKKHAAAVEKFSKLEG